MAERYGSLLRRSLCSADAFSERAIAFGSCSSKTCGFRSSASLVSVTCFDQRFVARFFADLSLAGLFAGFFAAFLAALLAGFFAAMAGLVVRDRFAASRVPRGRPCIARGE